MVRVSIFDTVPSALLATQMIDWLWPRDRWGRDDVAVGVKLHARRAVRRWGRTACRPMPPTWVIISLGSLFVLLGSLQSVPSTQPWLPPAGPSCRTRCPSSASRAGPGRSGRPRTAALRGLPVRVDGTRERGGVWVGLRMLGSSRTGRMDPYQRHESTRTEGARPEHCEPYFTTSACQSAFQGGSRQPPTGTVGMARTLNLAHFPRRPRLGAAVALVPCR